MMSSIIPTSDSIKIKIDINDSDIPISTMEQNKKYKLKVVNKISTTEPIKKKNEIKTNDIPISTMEAPKKQYKLVLKEKETVDDDGVPLPKIDTYNADAQARYYQKIKDKKKEYQRNKYCADKCPCGIRMANPDHLHSPKHYKYLYEIAVKEEMVKNNIPEEKFELYLWKYIGKFNRISIKLSTLQRNKYIKAGNNFYKPKD